MKTKIAVLAPRHYIDDLRAYYVPKADVKIEYIDEEPLTRGDLSRNAADLLNRGYAGYIGLVDWSALLAAYLNQRIHAPGVTPSTMAQMQDKYLSRKLQTKFVKYKGLAMDTRSANQITIKQYPLFVKPRRASMSFMAAQVDNPEELHKLTEASVTESLRIKNKNWQELYDLIGLSSTYKSGLDGFVVESLLPHGLQVTLDGYVQGRKIGFFGFTKSVFMPNRTSFKRFDYPYHLPKRLSRRILKHSRKLLRKSGFNNSLFNVEYKVDVETKKFALVEVNTRPSSQFMYPIFAVTGVHPLDVALDVVMGKKVKIKTSTTNHKTVSVCVLRREQDARVVKVPSNQDMSWFDKLYPSGRWKTFALAGETLSEFPNDSRTFRYAELIVPHEDFLKIHNYEDFIHNQFDKNIVLQDI